MSNLGELVRGFKPRRTFECRHTKIEVDGIPVRVGSENETDTWQTARIPFDAPEPVTHYIIKTEDILQDPALIRSARVSTGRDSAVVDEKAQGLVNFLYRDRHVTPFEGGVTFRLKFNMPVNYAHAFFRIFGSHNELSGRYGIIDGRYYTPLFRDNPRWHEEFRIAEGEALALYHAFVELGVANEMARLAHLYRFYTRFYFTVSLRHILDFLRIDESSGWRYRTTEFWEIRRVLLDIVKTWTPWAYKSFADNPRPYDFSWAKRELEGSRFFDPLTECGESYRLLLGRQGVVGFNEVYGSDDRILRRLSDFPNPENAFNYGGMGFFFRMPIHCFRQWVRHRHGVVTEYEQDFDRIVWENLFYIPERFRAQEGKMGAYKYFDLPDEANRKVRSLLADHIENAKARYKRLRDSGMSEENASMILPYCFFYDFDGLYPLGGLFNLLSLRTDSHAQLETRLYAQAVWPWVKERFPKVSQIFARHVYYGDWPKIRDFSQTSPTAT